MRDISELARTQVRGSQSFAWIKARSDAQRRAASRDSLPLLVGITGIVDALVVFSFSVLAFIIRNGLGAWPVEIISTSVFAALLTVNAFSIAGLYGPHINDGFVVQIWRVAQTWTVVFIVLLTVGYLTKAALNDYSRVWATLWYISTIFGFAAVRLAVVERIRRWRASGYLASTVAIVDLSDRGETIARKLSRDHIADVRLVGVFSNDSATGSGKSISDLIALSRLFRIDEVFVLVAAKDAEDESCDLATILRRLGTIPTNVRICPILPDLGEMPIRDTLLVHDIPVLTVHRRPFGAWSSIAKRVEDLAIGSLALLLLWPVMLIVAILIKTDSSGPVLFRQDRQGFNNNVIAVLKFRTMTHVAQSDGQVIQATRNDRRITRLGRVLRRTSIDELPQIFNVLRGEMSLVGPRPHAVVHNQQYADLIDDYLGRHRVQPGITGWAQVNGWRGETDTVDKMRKRVEFDLSYINNWSIALDLKIIVLTAISILFDRQAY
jgi:Undecaprenyl-phosphate glucose phosphotransferase